MPKKKTKNYDDFLLGKYIRQIENPDSIGWNPSSRTWTAPTLPGHDIRNRGMGIDIQNNADAKTLTEGRPGRVLSELEERQLRNDHIKYSLGALGRYNEIAGVQDVSPRKEAEAIGLIYRGDGLKIKNPNTPLGRAYRSDNEEDFHNAVTEYYHSKGLHERAKNNDLFWQTHTGKGYLSSVADRIEELKRQYSVPFGGGVRAEGGPINHWNSLSMREKAEMIKVAVDNGITNLKEIREKYNEFAGGGSKKKKPTSTVSPYAYKAMDYFMKKGLSKHAAAGLVGNLMRESGFNPTATNPYSGAYGLAQWLGPRKDKLFAKYGKNPTFDQQLDFAWWELNNTHKKGLQRLLNAPTAADAAADAMGYYEFQVGRQGAIDNMAKHKQDGVGAMKKGIANANLLMGLPADYSNIPLPEVATRPVELPTSQPAFMPINPEIFATVLPEPMTYSVKPSELATESSVAYSPKELERQERQQGMRNFAMVMNMLNPQDNSTMGIVDMLTANNYFNGGGDIHIKPSHRGRLTELKARTGKTEAELYNDGNPAHKKMVVFARNARKWKHDDGGTIYNGGELPEVEVVGYRPIELKTYYPLGKDYPWTGHSQLNIPITTDAADEYGLYGLQPTPEDKKWQTWVIVDKKPRDKGYNLLTNNCADATLNYLNAAFGTQESPMLFTTPGDVRDYAIDTLGGKEVKDRNGISTILIPRNKDNADIISRKVLKLLNNSGRQDKEYTGSHIEMRTKYTPKWKYGDGGNLFDDGGHSIK